MKVSLIIPTYNACERLYYNLLSLNMQNFDKKEFEAVIVDNGSKDNTREMLSTHNFNLNTKIIRTQQNQSRGRARNLAIQEASGDIIIFCDSDMICSHDFVESHILEHKTGNMVVCGTNWDKMFTFYYKDFKGRLLKNLNEIKRTYKQKYDTKHLTDKQCLIGEEEIINGSYKKYIFTQDVMEQGYKKVLDLYGSELNDYCFPWSFFITNNCSVRKENIIKAGMFDESYEGWGCEDLDLGYRLYKNGCSFVKKHIQSTHQEHPIKPGDDGIKNIYSFTEKYDSAEILLFYFYPYTTIDKNSLNDVIRDLKLLEKNKEFICLTSIFKDMLKIVRDKQLKVTADSNSLFYRAKNTKNHISQNKEMIYEACITAKSKYGGSAFTAALNKLSLSLFKIDILNN